LEADVDAGVCVAAVSGPEHARAPEVSPDRQWLLYQNWQVPSPGSPPPPIQLMRVPLAGGTPQSVFPLAGPTSTMSAFGWSSQVPDLRCPAAAPGRCIVSEDDEEKVVFSALDPVEGRRERLAQVDGPSREISWDVSPDGTRIAYAKWAWDAGEKISVITLADGHVRDIPVQGWTSLSAVSWLPDGNSLLLLSARRSGTTML
jgi:hypothetical protein